MKYKITLNNQNDVVVVADNMREAELQAYCAYGMDAIGMNISCDNGDFCLTVALEAWNMYLNETFTDFTIQDVFYHLLYTAYAWINFPTEKGFEYDYSDGCKYEYERIGKEGMEYLKTHDKLGKYMNEINWRW